MIVILAFCWPLIFAGIVWVWLRHASRKPNCPNCLCQPMHDMPAGDKWCSVCNYEVPK